MSFPWAYGVWPAVPWDDDLLLFGGDGTIMVLRGDPLADTEDGS